MMEKPVIYQVLPRLFGNRRTSPSPNGTLDENGCGKLADFDETVLKRIRELGVTHVWYTGVVRHATTTDYTDHHIPAQHPAVVKGKAGSPYAIVDYFDVDPDLATDVDHRMEEWEALVSRTHKAGMKVVMDFVPNHVARQYESVCKPEGVRDLGEDDDPMLHFSTRNNFYYCWGEPWRPQFDCGDYAEQPARATGNDCFNAHPGKNDWYETVKLNYGIDYCDAGGRSEHFTPIPDTWGKMTDILLFWASKGVDAFRCDMAEMVPAAFWAWATDKVKFVYPHVVFIGEVYAPDLYRRYIAAGFDWLYDKVGMYDSVRDVICHRRPAADITRQWQQTDDIGNHMLYFLENHDEQRLASDFFASDARRGIPGLIVSALLFRNPFMLYAGQEFGERGMDEEGFSGRDGRTTIFDYWTVDTLRRGYFDRRRLKKEERALHEVYQTVLNLANSEKAIREGETYDLMYVNPEMSSRQFAFIRKKDESLLLVVANFACEAVNVNLVVPRHAFEFLHIDEKMVSATDLLTGNELTLRLEADLAIGLTIPAMGGCIYKIH